MKSVFSHFIKERVTKRHFLSYTGLSALFATSAITPVSAQALPFYPIIGQGPYSCGQNNGVSDCIVPAGPPAITGIETVLLDTNLPNGEQPQTVLSTIDTLTNYIVGKTTGISGVSTLLALQQLPTSINAIAILTNLYRGGTFYWSTADESVAVTNDPGFGITVPSLANLSGNLGAWKRLYSGDVDFAWWGVIDDGVTTDPWGLEGIGPIIVSGTDNSAALWNWSLWAQAQSKIGKAISVSLKGGGQINANMGLNNCEFMLTNIPNLTINWNGTTFQNTYNASISGADFAKGSPWPLAQFAAPAGYLIHSTAVGDTSITVTNSGDIATSGVIVGDWIGVQALDVQFLGTPSNNQLFEYVQVTGINGSTIKLASGLKNEYLSTYPDYNLFGTPLCGKARFWMYNGIKLPQNLFTIWDIDHFYNDGIVNLPPGGATSILTLGNLMPGSGYTNGTYTGVPLTVVSGGNGVGGVGATATIVVSGGTVSTVTLVNPGNGYAAQEVLSSASIGSGTGFAITVTGLFGQSYASLSGRQVTLNNWEGVGLSETIAQLITANHCKFITGGETDKLVEKIIYNNCTSAGGIGSQSAVPNSHIIIGGSYGLVTGGAKEFYAVGATFAELTFVGSQYGYTGNATLQNCIIKSTQKFPSVLDGALGILNVDGVNITYANGRFTINASLSSGITTLNVVPGMMVAWQATGSDALTGIFPGPIGTGVVLSISDNGPSPTQYYIDTDLGAAVPPWCTTNNLWIFHWGKVDILSCTGCDNIRLMSDACAAGYEYFNYQRYVFTGKSAQNGQFVGYGALVSVGVNVPPTRGGNTVGATLVLTFLTYDDTSFVADSGGTVVTINIGSPGKRLFTQTALTGKIANSIATLGSITAGTLYTTGTYTNVPLTGGTGTGATANITVAGGGVTAVTIVKPGNGYTVSDSLSATAASIGGTGSGFHVPVASVNAGDSVTVGGAGASALPSNRVLYFGITYALSNLPPTDYQSPLFELILTYDTGIVRKPLTANFDVFGSVAILPTLGLLP